MEIQAPHKYSSCPKPWIFLAGSIEMGKAENWQWKVTQSLERATVLNPRRDDWDSSWVQSIENEQFTEQVEWELQAQEDADIILMHFDPTTKSPITLLELGLFKGKTIVHCPDGFWKKGNVDIVCRRYKIPQVSSIDELIDSVSKSLIPNYSK